MRENHGQRKPVNWCILRSANDSTRKTDIYQEDYTQMIVCLIIYTSNKTRRCFPKICAKCKHLMLNQKRYRKLVLQEI